MNMASVVAPCSAHPALTSFGWLSVEVRLWEQCSTLGSQKKSRRCYEEARRRVKRRLTNMTNSRKRRGLVRRQPSFVSSVRKGSGDSYSESSERQEDINK